VALCLIARAAISDGAALAQDHDQDSVPAAQDLCPEDAEDVDGFEDHDGCPDPDNDGDGILDAQDQCPNEPEDFDTQADDDGCPDPDDDGDGVPDVQDLCPHEQEDGIGAFPQDGCSLPDRERWGLAIGPPGKRPFMLGRAPISFGDGSNHTFYVGFSLHNVSPTTLRVARCCGDQFVDWRFRSLAVAANLEAHDEWFWVSGAIGVSIAAPVVPDGDRVRGVYASGAAGIRLLGWPISPIGGWFHPINLSAGLHFTTIIHDYYRHQNGSREPYEGYPNLDKHLWALGPTLVNHIWLGPTWALRLKAVWTPVYSAAPIAEFSIALLVGR
jgi:hypothetical protein